MRRTTLLIAATPLLALGLLPSLAATKRDPGAMTEKGVLTLYEGQKFEGESIEITKDMSSISYDFTIGSIGIYPGEKWELCEQTRFRGTCNVMAANETKLGRIKIQSARMVKLPVAAAPAPAK
jgi:Beta/Gamma crystallin